MDNSTFRKSGQTEGEKKGFNIIIESAEQYLLRAPFTDRTWLICVINILISPTFKLPKERRIP